MDSNSDQLRYEIKNCNPVTASNYSDGLSAIADEYEQFMGLHLSKAERGTAKMYVSSVRDGSIISDLQPYIAGTLPLIEGLKDVKAFATYLKTLIDWTQGRAERPEIVDERKTLKNISNIVKPTVNDEGSQVNVGVINNHGTMNFAFTVSEPQARSIQGFVRERLGKLKEVMPGVLHEGVVLYWDQTRKKLSSKVGDKGKIDSISDDSIRVNFADEGIKQEMVLNHENPYHKAYVVDVYVQTAAGRNVLYTVSRLIDVIDLDPAS